jgi:hypothetical protein
MYQYKIYPQYNLVIVTDQSIIEERHFTRLFSEVFDDDDFNPEYQWIYDGRLVNWGDSDTDDIIGAVELIIKHIKKVTPCAVVIANIGQMAYTEAMMMSTERFALDFFSSVERAAAYLKIPSDGLT